MSKRPRIKQADGSLLDLPLDAETIKGKTLEEIALKTDIPTKTSQLTNDSGFLTEPQDLSGYIPQGGTLSAPLTVTGGDRAAAGKIILDQNNLGQITNTSTQTLFGFTTSTAIAVGHSSYKTNLRGTSIESMATMQTKAITPVSNNTYTLGSSSNKWKEIHGTTIYQNGKQVANKEDIPTLKTINGESIVGSGNIVIEGGGGGSGDLSNYVTKDEGLSKDGTATLNAHSSNEFYTLVTASDIACINYSASTVPGKHTPSTYYFGNGTGASGMKSGVIYAGNIYQNDKQVANKDDIPSRVSGNAPARSYIDYIGEENKNSQYQVAFRNNTQDDGICWSKFANMADSSMTPSACTYNGFFYVTSSTNSLSGADANPFLQYHSSAPDFRILTTAYNDQWLQQIATDFRSPYIYVRRRENGSWSNWKRVLTTDDIGGRLYQHILNVNVSRDTTGNAVFYCNFVIYTNFPDVLTDANAVSLLKPYFNPDNSGYGKLQLMNTVEIQSSVHKSYTVTFFLGNYPGDSNQYLYTQYRSNASGDSSLVENVLYSDGTTKLGIRIIQKDTVTPI